MKIDKLIEKLQDNSLSLPATGTGRGGQILARDLENTLGDYFMRLKYHDDAEALQHCLMARAMTPMKAYRYNKLDKATKETIFDDDNEWYAEEKFNGWRMRITFIPQHGFMFWGGNISDVDFLPMDYTQHMLLEDFAPVDFGTTPFCIDAEVMPTGIVLMDNGLYSSGTLDTLKAILGSDTETALKYQADGCKLNFYCFDKIEFCAGYAMFDVSAGTRNIELEACLDVLHNDYGIFDQFILVAQHFFKKKELLHSLWRLGKEGIVLKHYMKGYVPAGRLRTHCIKVKRAMSGEIGDDIDAFIIGWEETPECSKLGLIGSIKLGVYVNKEHDCVHHIATVSAMPDPVREQLTYTNSTGDFDFNNSYLNKVLTIDGQELSSRTKRLMHANVDWIRGFRLDKNADDCTFDLKGLKEVKF